MRPSSLHSSKSPFLLPRSLTPSHKFSLFPSPSLPSLPSLLVCQLNPFVHRRSFGEIFIVRPPPPRPSTCHCLCSASIHYHFTPCFPLPLLESKSPNSGKSQKAKLPYMGKHVSSCLFPGNPCLQRYDSLGARLQTTLVTRDVQCYYVGVAWIVNSQLQCFYGVPLGERENLMTVIK